MIYKNNNSLPSQQKGATLFTALVFLTLMTIVSVSATKLSILDILVAGNNEQQMRLYQTTENDLHKLTTVSQLYKPLTKTPGHEFDETTGIYKIANPDNSNSLQQITDPGKRYECAGFSGQGVSIGPDVPPCDLYDFQVKSKLSNTSAVDRHNRGAGKEKPNPSKNSYL